MIGAPDRIRVVRLIKEAVAAGARTGSACQEIGISLRTFRRWTQEGAVKADGRPHHGSNSLNDIANRHLQMAIPNTIFMEVLLSHEAWWHGLVEEIQIDSDGFAHAPSKPGLGYEVDLELAERQKIAVLG